MKSVVLSADATKAEADAAVTKSCYCEGAMRERLKVKTIRTINEVFGMECAPEFKPVEEDELSMIIELGNDLADEVLTQVSLTLKDGCKCKMKLKSLECIEVEREEKKKMKRSN